MPTIQENVILNTIENSLRDFALGDIKKSRKANMVIASFILSFCFIGQLSAHRFFGEKPKLNDGEKFKEFIKKYFNQGYHQYAGELYTDLRSRLVHNFSVTKKFALSEHNDLEHLKAGTNG